MYSIIKIEFSLKTFVVLQYYFVLISKMAFKFEDFVKLTVIFDSLNAIVALLTLLLPNNIDVFYFREQLDIFEQDIFFPFVETLIERNIPENINDEFPLELAIQGDLCYVELDSISDDIFTFIDHQNFENLLEILDNNRMIW